MCCNEKRRGVHDNNRGAGARSANAVRDKVIRVERRIDPRAAAPRRGGGGGGHGGCEETVARCTRASPSTNTSRAE